MAPITTYNRSDYHGLTPETVPPTRDSPPTKEWPPSPHTTALILLHELDPGSQTLDAHNNPPTHIERSAHRDGIGIPVHQNMHGSVVLWTTTPPPLPPFHTPHQWASQTRSPGVTLDSRQSEAGTPLGTHIFSSHHSIQLTMSLPPGPFI